MSRRVFILSAPSGAGKTTLARCLTERLPELAVAVSHTTRDMRTGERDGVDYFFVERSAFDAMIGGDAFLEYAEVFGNYYGTSRQEVERLQGEGKTVLLDIDWQGARQVRERLPDVGSIFILPPSLEELEKRLRERGRDSEEVIRRRMTQAADEMSHRDEYDHQVVNQDLAGTVEQLVRIVSDTAEHQKQGTIRR